MRLRIALVPFIAITLASAVPALAGGTLTMVLDGEPEFQGLVVQAATAWLDTSLWVQGPPTLDAATRQRLAGCFAGNGDEACIAPVAAKANTDRLLFIALVREPDREGSPSLLLNGWIMNKKGKILANERRRCGPCLRGKIEEASRDLVDALTRTAAIKTANTLLKVRSVPTGAIVIIDNEVIGTTELTYPTYPGPHKVSIKKTGYQSMTRDVVAAEGVTKDIDFELLPGSDEPTPGQTRGVLPWIVLGAGAALMASGAVVLALDEDAPPIGRDRTAHFTDTLVPGIALIAGGAAVTGAGVYLYIARTPRSGEETTTLGIAGNF